MRNGSAAIVPLLLAIMLLFWFIMFMGGASDTQKTVNDVQELKHLQSKLLLPALKKKYQEERDNNMSNTAASASANKYIKDMMYKNGIDAVKGN